MSSELSGFSTLPPPILRVELPRDERQLDLDERLERIEKTLLNPDTATKEVQQGYSQGEEPHQC